MKITTDLHLMPKFRKHGAVPPLYYTPSLRIKGQPSTVTADESDRFIHRAPASCRPKKRNATQQLQHNTTQHNKHSKWDCALWHVPNIVTSEHVPHAVSGIWHQWHMAVHANLAARVTMKRNRSCLPAVDCV